MQKKVEDDKKKYLRVCVYEVVQICRMRARSTFLQTEQPCDREAGEGGQQNPRDDFGGVKVFSSWDESDCVGGCCRWDSRNMRTCLGDALVSRIHLGFFFNVFSRFNTGVQPVTQTRRRCVCSRLTWTFWFVQFWEEEWRTTAVSRCGGVTETCLIKPSDAIKS